MVRNISGNVKFQRYRKFPEIGQTLRSVDSSVKGPFQWVSDVTSIFQQSAGNAMLAVDQVHRPPANQRRDRTAEQEVSRNVYAFTQRAISDQRHGAAEQHGDQDTEHKVRH